METFGRRRDASGHLRLDCPHRGLALLRHALYTKGTAFTQEERVALGLEGLLPHAVSTIEQQSRRVYANITRKPDALERHVGLAALQDRNEHLFYRLLVDHVEEFLPIVHAPVAGRACQEWSHIFRRARGLWITPGQRGRIHDVLANAPFDDVRLIVATDNEQVLGKGDLGAGGLGCATSKLALYTAAGGIPPWQTLPVCLDVGTDNPALLDDELYLGWRCPRLRGPDYDTLLEEFVLAVRRRFPRALLQWEGLGRSRGFALLARYGATLASFDDDIQGCAAVAAAGVQAGVRCTGTPLAAQRVVILGAGAVGLGSARLLREVFRRAGLTGEALVAAVATLDRSGLLLDDRQAEDVHKRDAAWPAALAEKHGLGPGQPRDLTAVVRALRPTVLIGAAGAPGAFDEVSLRELARHAVRPLVLPLSSPASRSEATPADILAWTQGRALVASGSQFDPVRCGAHSLEIRQGHTAFVFPGLGLGVLVAEARVVTDGMLAAAAAALAAEVPLEDLAAGRLFPPLRDVRRVAAAVAQAVVREARDAGVGRPLADAEIPRAVREAQWEPRYLPIDAAPPAAAMRLTRAESAGE